MSRGGRSLADESWEARVAIEHRRIDAIFAEVAGALREGDPDADVCAAFAVLRESLETHVDQEDRLYYPALRALRPAHRSAIERLIEGHVHVRAELAAIEAAIAAGRRDAASAALAVFVRAFAEHEAAEEQLLRTIDAELHAAAGG